MSSLIRTFIILAGLLGSGTLAGPAIRPKDIQVLPVLQERLPSIKLGSYDLTTSHTNDVLFDLTQKSPLDPNSIAQSSLKVTCLSCTTSGFASITTTGVSKDVDIIKDIKSFFKSPLDLITQAFGLNVKVSFENVAGHFNFGIEATENTTYSFPIFSSSTPLGAAVSEDVSFGMVLFVDLVFSLSESVDLQAGFEFAFPEGAYIVVDPLLGEIINHGFDGGETNALPVTITSGSATFKVALRVRVQAGTTVILFGTGFDFELGIFADLIEYQATISSTPACELSITEGLDVNIGAFAHAVGEINYSKFGASPALVTTILEVPLPSLCLTRPAATSVLALPTDSAAILTDTVPSLPSIAASLSTGPLATNVASTPTNTSTGGLFFQASSPAPSPVATPSSITSGILFTPPSTNSTITSAPALTTSTVYTTEIVTLTSCADTVLHCPASLTTEVIITSTRILYTTICPVGATLPTTLPANLSQPTYTPSPAVASIPTSKSNITLSISHKLTTQTTTLFKTTSLTLNPVPISTSTFSSSSSVPQPTILILTTALMRPLPLKLTPCATPHTETIYTPTFTNPIYTMPTATVFAAPFPEWNLTPPSFVGLSMAVASVSTINVKPVVVESSTSVKVESLNYAPSSVATPVVHGLEEGGPGGEIVTVSMGVSATGSSPIATASLTPFTGAASGVVKTDSVYSLVVAIGVGMLALW